MDNGFKVKRKCPYENSNFLSKISFFWTAKEYYNANKKQLEIEDLFKTTEADSSDYLCNKLENNWTSELQRAKEKGIAPSLLKAMIKTFMWHYLINITVLGVQNLIFKPLQPLILASLIPMFAEANKEKRFDLFYYAIGLNVAMLFSIITVRYMNYNCRLLGLKMNVAVSSLIYRKMLKIHKKSSLSNSGKLINLLSSDTGRLEVVVAPLCHLVVLPLQIMVTTWLLWRFVGIACLPGILCIVFLSGPMQGVVGKLIKTSRLKLFNVTYHRIKLMKEVISGIQVIKMYAWEKAQEKIMNKVRKNEMSILRKIYWIKNIGQIVHNLDKLAILLTVINYFFLGIPLTPEIVFPAFLYFKSIRLTLALYCTQGVSFVTDIRISFSRFEEFLLLEEKETLALGKCDQNEIILNNVNAYWSSDKELTLKNLTLHIPSGCLCVVVGQVGSSKSTLLHLLLGEMSKLSGVVKLGGTISYSSQDPWIFPSSIRKNILFGKKYYKLLYDRVVKVCALDKDFEFLPEKDLSVVGDRGVSLSGGQKARINLARAVYRASDIYLFDDPLSAVDVLVGKYLFEECFIKHLNGKTRIVVTHQVQHAKKADMIIIMKNGTIDAQGTFEDLSSNYADFSKLLEKTSSVGNISLESSLEKLIKKTPAETERNDETMLSAEVKDDAISPLTEYLKSINNSWLIFGVIFIFLVAEFANISFDIVLALWTNLETDKQPEDGKINDLSEEDTNKQIFTSIFDVWAYESKLYMNSMMMYHYCIGLIVSIFGLIYFKVYLYISLLLRASERLYKNMFKTILRVPLKFFHQNPSGRILNRFAKDMGVVEEVMSIHLLDSMTGIFMVVGTIATIIIMNPYVLIVLLPFIVCFRIVLKSYLKTTRNITHLQGITKSPIFSHLTATSEGISTIRACNASEILIKEFEEHQNVHTSSCILILSFSDLLSMVLDLISLILVSFTTVSFIIQQYYVNVNNAAVALCISSCMTLLGSLQFTTRQVIEVINELSSVRRIIEYTKLEKEGPFETSKDKPKLRKCKGRIEFKNVYLRYEANGVPVLKNLNFTIESGLKVGIIGRTGAGKSSIVNALFRLAPFEGSVLIDEVDIKDIGLQDLRKSISIIPQQPFLFPDTTRRNLDPFNDFTDAKLWEVLEEVKLKESIPSLDHKVSIEGSNFSSGERQLFCLARALLRANSIIVLDEATANIDSKTDALIQATLRKKIGNCTVLTIAHRLNSIMDSDKIMVMDSGELVEFDHPHILLQDSGSHLSKMVAETGPSIELHLKSMARECYEAQHITTTY